MEYSGYTNLIKSNRVPDRLKEFLSKIYIPTAEEIGDKITAGMKMAKDKSPLAPSSESIVEKIKAKMKAAETKE